MTFPVVAAYPTIPASNGTLMVEVDPLAIFVQRIRLTWSTINTEAYLTN